MLSKTTFIRHCVATGSVQQRTFLYSPLTFSRLQLKLLISKYKNLVTYRLLKTWEAANKTPCYKVGRRCGRHNCLLIFLLDTATCLDTNATCLGTHTTCLGTHATCLSTHETCLGTHATCLGTPATCLDTHATCLDTHYVTYWAIFYVKYITIAIDYKNLQFILCAILVLK